MKVKTISLLSLVFILSMGSCHFGADAAKEDVARNVEYKGKRADREAATALPADAADKMNGTVVSAPVDTASTSK